MSTQQASRELPLRWLLVRDIGLFLLGAGLAVWEITTHEVIRDSVLVFAGSVLGVPAAATVLDAFRSRGGTPAPSSPSLAEPPPPSALP